MAATCLLAWPRAIRRSTSTSRSVRPAGSGHRRRAAGLAGGGEHGVDLDPSEAAGVDLVEQLRRRVRRGERRAVGPVLGHGVVGVGGGQQPSAEVELVSRRAAVVAGAVGALVVAGGDVGERGQQRAAAQDPLAQVGVQADPFPLLGAERAGTIPDPVRHADAPDVVHQRGAAERDGVARRTARPRPAAATARAATPGRVAAEERRLQVGEVGHRGRARASSSSGADRRHRRRLGVEHRGARVVADRRPATPAAVDQRRRPPPGRSRGRAGAPAPRPPPASPPAVPTARRRGRPRRPAPPSAPPRRPGRPGTPCRPSARRREPARGTPTRPARAGPPGGPPTSQCPDRLRSLHARVGHRPHHPPGAAMGREVLGQVAHEVAHALAGLGHQHRGHRRVERHVVAARQHRGLRRIRRAAEEPQQRHVVHARPRRRIQARAPPPSRSDSQHVRSPCSIG